MFLINIKLESKLVGGIFLPDADGSVNHSFRCFNVFVLLVSSYLDVVLASYCDMSAIPDMVKGQW